MTYLPPAAAETISGLGHYALIQEHSLTLAMEDGWAGWPAISGQSSGHPATDNYFLSRIDTGMQLDAGFYRFCVGINVSYPEVPTGGAHLYDLLFTAGGQTYIWPETPPPSPFFPSFFVGSTASYSQDGNGFTTDFYTSGSGWFGLEESGNLLAFWNEVYPAPFGGGTLTNFQLQIMRLSGQVA